VSDIAHVLHTPIPAVLDMEWTDVLAWHEQAVRIVKAKAGIL
jgi:hypothetical protein